MLTLMYSFCTTTGRLVLSPRQSHPRMAFSNDHRSSRLGCATARPAAVQSRPSMPHECPVKACLGQPCMPRIHACNTTLMSTESESGKQHMCLQAIHARLHQGSCISMPPEITRSILDSPRGAHDPSLHARSTSRASLSIRPYIAALSRKSTTSAGFS